TWSRRHESAGCRRDQRTVARFDAEPAPEAQAHVYRIVQEAVTNAVKHARPTRIRVELDSDDHTLFAKVTDNGRGMTSPPTAAAIRSPPREAAPRQSRRGQPRPRRLPGPAPAAYGRTDAD
ncbi:MAG: hypothetical protein QOF84_6323, partial [Streptomyces sp.]|nr:hypothetical protein [Streptomyces sp.]